MCVYCILKIKERNINFKMSINYIIVLDSVKRNGKFIDFTIM